MSQSLTDPLALLRSLEQAGLHAVIVVTGGGSQAIPHLLSTPGASAVVLECLVPYAREAIDRLLGGPQESYCSSRTARRLAVLAWQRACGLGTPPAAAIGVAVTASLRTRFPKRGPHRIVVAVQRLGATTVATLVLHKDARSRAEEEQVAAALLLEQLSSGGQSAGPRSGSVVLLDGEHVEIKHCSPPLAWQELLAGTRSAVHLGGGSAATRSGAEASPVAGGPAAGLLVFPGSFDPFHEGHRQMALIAQEVAKRPIDYELSVVNVDKPALDYMEIQSRAAQFAGRSLWLTRAATFVEKLDIFPEGIFVMGADTFTRLADPHYYGGSAEATDRAVQRIASQSRGLIVFGRERNGVFEEPLCGDIPPPLREVMHCVSEQKFRMDISSTSLRSPTAADD